MQPELWSSPKGSWDYWKFINPNAIFRGSAFLGNNSDLNQFRTPETQKFKWLDKNFEADGMIVRSSQGERRSDFDGFRRGIGRCKPARSAHERATMTVPVKGKNGVL